MTKTHTVRPEDILADGIDTTTMNGMTVRKGTIAAFLANLDVLENSEASEHHKQEAIQTMKELAPGVICIGLHKHVIFKSSVAEQILIDAEKCTQNQAK